MSELQPLGRTTSDKVEAGNRSGLSGSDWLLPLILVSAGLTRLIWVVCSPASPTSDFAIYLALGQNISQGMGFSLNGEPTAYRAPGYPVLLAGVLFLFDGDAFSVRIVNVILGILTVWLAYQIARTIFDQKVALIIAGIVAFTPSLIAYTSLPATENLAIPLLLSFLYFYLRWWLSTLTSLREKSFKQGVTSPRDYPNLWGRDSSLELRPFSGQGLRSVRKMISQLIKSKRRLIYLCLSGLSLGLACLTRPEFFFLPLAFAIYYYTQIRRWVTSPIMIIIKYTIIVNMLVLLVMIPWAARNYMVFHRLMPISSNGGIMFLISFNEQAADKVGDPHILLKLRELAAKNQWDEYQLSQAAFQEALRYIREHPFQSLSLAPVKLFHLFRDDVSGISWNFKEANDLVFAMKVVAQLYYLILLLLAMVAVFFRRAMVSQRYKISFHPSITVSNPDQMEGYAPYGFLLVPIFYWVLYFSIFAATDRYHLPILPIIATFSAFSMSQILRKIQSGDLLTFLNRNAKIGL